jgi:two-component system NtrC family sensor kinase
MPDDVRSTPDVSLTPAELAHLAASVAHHLINVYNGITGEAETLHIEGLEPHLPLSGGDSRAKQIGRKAIAASDVARHFIDVARRHIDVGTAPVDLQAIAAEAIEARRAAAPASIRWEVDLQPVRPARGTAGQLRQAIDHLLANACEACGDAGGTVSVTLAPDARGRSVLEVRDTGPGMASETLARAFEPFFTTRDGHAGIGLNLAREITRRHGGQIAVESEAGTGTCARITLGPTQALAEITDWLAAPEGPASGTRDGAEPLAPEEG